MIVLRLNHQQLAFLRTVADRAAELRDIGDLVRAALAAAPPHEPSPSPAPIPRPPTRTAVAEHVLEPGTGKALEVRAGQVIRISQIGGHQCVDMNVFRLADRRERLHVGRTRGMQGPRPAAGDVLWSNAPWERPIMAILGSTTTTDTSFPFCSRLIYSAYFGVHDRTNCEEIQAEAQREYGLTPWDIHESLNLFMNTATDPVGVAVIRRNAARPGDWIEFAALLDLLVVPNVCGDDLTNCSNFGIRPVRVTIERGRPRDAESARQAAERAAVLGLPSPRHRRPAPEPLHADPGYVAAFPHLPLRPVAVPVAVDLSLTARFAAARDVGRYGDDDAAALRDIVLTWAIDRLGAFAGNA